MFSTNNFLAIISENYLVEIKNFPSPKTLIDLSIFPTENWSETIANNVWVFNKLFCIFSILQKVTGGFDRSSG